MSSSQDKFLPDIGTGYLFLPPFYVFMIQRIQSIWLLLAALSSGLIFLAPLASGPGDLHLYIYGWEAGGVDRGDAGVLWMLALACTLLPLPVIFQFRSRRRQRRMIGVVILLNLILANLVYFEMYHAEHIKPAFGLFLIPAAILFLFLASLAIANDEKLVRSADRLR